MQFIWNVCQRQKHIDSADCCLASGCRGWEVGQWRYSKTRQHWSLIMEPEHRAGAAPRVGQRHSLPPSQQVSSHLQCSQQTWPGSLCVFPSQSCRPAAIPFWPTTKGRTTKLPPPVSGSPSSLPQHHWRAGKASLIWVKTKMPPGWKILFVDFSFEYLY